MKDFLTYLHTQLVRVLEIHKLSEKLSKEDEQLYVQLWNTVVSLENYAEYSKDGKLIQIADDMVYAANHMRVWFKAEDALKDVAMNIRNY
jgi:hypothetical protein